ncbi:MAG: hypothetical protein RIC16_00785 [Rhodospirillales bacterium]
MIARPLRKRVRLSGAPLALFAAALLLTGCYLPARYDAEIEITREGYYSMIFDGYLVKLPFYDDLRKGGMAPSEEAEKIELYRRDLENDPAMSGVSYLRQGIYKVHWERDGDLTRDKYVAFLRRNENMLSIRYIRDDYTIRLAGSGLASEQKQQIVDAGLDSVGEVRVITNAKVVADNATSKRDWPSRGPGFRMYTWELPNIFAPSPQLVISLR